MMSAFRRTLPIVIATAALASLLSLGHAADGTVSWTLTATPSKGGSIRWSSTAPQRDGVVSSKSKLTLDRGAYLDLTFEANPGYELLAVIKNGSDWTPFLDQNDHFRFGPVENDHSIRALFAPVVPTGTFDLAAPTDLPSVPQMVDLTGSYTGISPTRHRRPYDFDFAMDERGKLSILGTLAGHETRDGGPIEASAASVRSVNGVPTVETKGKFVGTRDGVETSGSGTTSTSTQLQQIGGESNVVTGSFDYKAKVGGVPFADKNVPFEEPATEAQAANVKRGWSVRISVLERARKKGGPILYASALLTLPNGDVVEFPEKRAKYSPKKGYKLRFKKGTNLSLVPAAVDKKSRITIKGMTLEESGGVWTPVGGEIDYRFLGQKGKAPLVDFLQR